MHCKLTHSHSIIDSFSFHRISYDFISFHYRLIPELIFQEIEANSSQLIRKQSLNYYHLCQKHLILDSLDGMSTIIIICVNIVL